VVMHAVEGDAHEGASVLEIRGGRKSLRCR
jgi:hypothetical protein